MTTPARTPATPRELILTAARLDALVEQQPAHPANGDRILTAQSLRARAEQLAQETDQPDPEPMPSHVAVEAMAEEYAASVQVKTVERDERAQTTNRRSYCMPECWQCGRRYRWYYNEGDCPRLCEKCKKEKAEAEKWETAPCGVRFRRSALMTVAHVEEAFGKVAARLAAEEGQWPEPAILARQLAAVRRRGRKGRQRQGAGRRYEARTRAADLRERGMSY